jgi:hypothetical protein
MSSLIVTHRSQKRLMVHTQMALRRRSEIPLSKKTEIAEGGSLRKHRIFA